MNISRVLFAFLVVVSTSAVVGPSTPAGAAPASGCSGQATTYDKQGRILDKATAPGQGGTSKDPLHIHVDGSLAWRGSTDAVLQNGSYKVTVSGATVQSGTFENGQAKKSWSGTEDIGKRLDKIPVLGWLTKTLKPTATLKADYTVTASQGTCSGSVVLKIGDSPTFTPLWFVGVALFLWAFWMLFSPWRLFRR